ncbi:Sec-independent protein translocase subunit TatA [Motilibacter aurantiacus]|uniref:Sec-independent protein translocase subunit TatA n=1 Tax=Motilibacter aurantiacus TaxID=2714955 RepID=UPI00140A774E|nr:Sec-independent protein translocase subunit TatA [Motilibacter aurantiacus]NHC47328.1 Sec-independent protein translocase subunit TatA [Motilibacter aurantiacus]
MRNLQGWEIFVLLAVVVLLFGAKRLPDTARGLGRSLRIFKAETKGLREDDAKDKDATVTTAAAEPAVVVEPRPIESGVVQTTPAAGAHAAQRDAADR